MLSPFKSVLLVVVGASLLSGCVTPSRDRAWIARSLRARLGAGLDAGGEEASLGVLEDGVDENEAVSLALALSPAYRAELTRLDAARANVDEASRPANPQITILGPLGPVTAIATLLAPLESLWQIPQRTETASRELESIAESLVMAGLDLARAVLLAHTELGLAADRLRVRSELAELATEVARIAEVRARVGEVTSLEWSVVSAEARAASDLADAAVTELDLARARLAAAIGIGGGDATLTASFLRPGVASGLPLPTLIAIARASRPDARAAELMLAAAAGRAGWERSRVLALALHVEGQWSEPLGPSLRLGGRIELPIFGANPGGIGRADAEVARAEAQVAVVAQSVILDVTLAYARAVQASRSLETFRTSVLPALDEALRVATVAHGSGEETYLVVLDALRRLGDARMREAELLAESRRARAELERALGARLEIALTEGPPTEETP